MTIDDLTSKTRKIAIELRKTAFNTRCSSMAFKQLMAEAEEYEQLSEWLEELKAYIEIGTVEECRNSVLDIQKAYNKAIDDFVNACKEDILCQTFGLHINGIEKMAEQLKAGGENVQKK